MDKPNNQNALKHGGQAALERVQHGTPFAPLAMAKQADVIAELDALGVEPIEERAAIRLQTVSDLFYDAIQAAAQRGDIEAADRYTKRFGWMQTKALQAWQFVKANRKQSRGKLASVLEDYNQDDSICPTEAPGQTE